MSGVGGVGGAMSVDRVMQLRAQILERNQALARAGSAEGAAPTQSAATKPASFADTLQDALKDVNASQNKASALSESYERGETLARQEASVGFEATLQVRNKLLSAYKDIMSMPV